jgi:hypothetical protein
MGLSGLTTEKVSQRETETDENDETADHDDGQQGRLQPQHHAADQRERHAQGGRQVPGRYAGRLGFGLRPGFGFRRPGLSFGLRLTFDEIRR